MEDTDYAKLFIPRKSAIKARHYGFRDNCLAFYSSSATAGDVDYDQLWPAKILDKPYKGHVVEYSDLTNPESCLAPTHQQIIDWARTEHSFHIKIMRDGGYWLVTAHDLLDEENESPENDNNTRSLSYGYDYYGTLNAGLHEYITNFLKYLIVWRTNTN